MFKLNWIIKNNLSNLETLRHQLAHRLVILFIGVSGLTAWNALIQNPFSNLTFFFFLSLLGLGIGIQFLLDKHLLLAQHVMVWGLTASLLIAMGLFTTPWLPFFSLLLVFISAMLISGSEWVVAGLIALIAAWLDYNGLRAYPLSNLLTLLALAVAIAWLTVGTLYTAMQWIQNTQQNADSLLDEVRNHRAELSRVLKSSELANALLRHTQRDLIMARKQAEEARLLKEQFAANISHELRTPLNLIMGFSEVMHHSPQLYGPVDWSPTLRRDVHHIYHNSRHLVGMIDDILELSRSEMAAFTLNKQLTSVADLLRETAEIAENFFRDTSVALTLEIAPNLPALAMDRTRMRQVLLNLLKNAQRFTQQGSVSLHARRLEDDLLITIRDTGSGISEEKLPHVFDAFYQIDFSLNQRYQGAGLGLSISKHFVEAHDGRIWVESQEGVGSTFSLTLPINPLPAPLSAPPSDRSTPQWPPARPCILLLDFDPVVVTLIKGVLKSYQIVSVSTMKPLQQAIMQHHPQLMVRNILPSTPHKPIDITLPIPLIECALPSRSWMTTELAVEAILIKPITSEQLLREIERLGNIKNILVIDDNREFYQLIKRMLAATPQPFEVRHAYDGVEGLSMMAQQRPDLVLLDMVISDHENSTGLRDEIRQHPELATIPVIILTAGNLMELISRQPNNKLVIHQVDGLDPHDILACLEAVADVLKPDYSEQPLTEDWLAHGALSERA